MSAWAGAKVSFFAAAILMMAPVEGFRPLRSGVALTLNLPNRGVGLGILVGDELLRGIALAAGEIGYLPLGGDPFTPRSLEQRALESSHSAPAVFSSGMAPWVAPPKRCATYFDRLEAGDAAALQTIKETAHTAALLVLTITSVIDPDRVVFGGNIGGWPELVRRVAKLMPSVQRPPIRVEHSRLGTAPRCLAPRLCRGAHAQFNIFDPRLARMHRLADAQAIAFRPPFLS